MAKGYLVVLEGCDRVGKTTQASLLSSHLNNIGIECKTISFPYRDTQIGKLLDSYLTSKTTLEKHVAHLLFSANRYEMKSVMDTYLDNGVSIIVDRYTYSGLVYSSINGCSIEWCSIVDCKLRSPDIKLFLDLHPENAVYRGLYGDERFENIEFQTKVYEAFMELIDDTWIIVDADKTITNLSHVICSTVVSLIDVD
jgi:dTMP kinase